MVTKNWTGQVVPWLPLSIAGRWPKNLGMQCTSYFTFGCCFFVFSVGSHLVIFLFKQGPGVTRTNGKTCYLAKNLFTYIHTSLTDSDWDIILKAKSAHNGRYLLRAGRITVGRALIKKSTQICTQHLISPCYYVPFNHKKIIVYRKNIDVFFPGDRHTGVSDVQ